MLLADRSLALLDECVDGGKMRRPLEQESAKSFSRGIEARRVVEPTDEWKQLGERKTHWARNSTVCSDGVARPGAGSTVTRTLRIGRGTSGGWSVANVTRPDSSGATVPALTGSVAVNSQIW